MSYYRNVKLVSKYLLPTLKESQISEQFHSKSAELLERAGYTRKSSAGVYNYLPLGQKVLHRLTGFIDEAMQEIDGAMRVKLAHLQPKSLWDRTGRADIIGDEIFKTGPKDDLILAPTHEEEITTLLSSLLTSHRQLPLRLYQIGEKFRNETRPRGGLLRCREFLMKDLYTFDQSLQDAQITYDQVCTVYRKIFTQLGLKFYQAQASNGAIGGSNSHEFHLECESGQDTLLFCEACNFTANKDLEIFTSLTEFEILCPKCSNSNTRNFMKTKKGLEIGHTFLLGTKYSQKLDTKFKDQYGKESFAEMGCYGIGVSRLMAAVVEAAHDEKGIVWPALIAPFNSYIISLNPENTLHTILDLLENTNTPELLQSTKDSILFDDRPQLSYSHKFKDALLIGVPNIFVIGGRKSTGNSGVEWYKRVVGGVELQN